MCAGTPYDISVGKNIYMSRFSFSARWNGVGASTQRQIPPLRYGMTAREGEGTAERCGIAANATLYIPGSTA